MRVAVATCASEVDPDSDLLLRALTDLGVDAELVVWNDECVDWNDYTLTVVRSTWDYTSQREAFLAWARSLAHVVNPYEALEYSSDKRYLFDVAARGFPIVESRLVAVGETPTFYDVDFVVKPCVGAGSIDADRYRPEEVERASEHVARLHALSRDVLVQPYVASVDEVGETALIFIGGEFSHSMVKAAMLNVAPDTRDRLYRAERMSRGLADPAALALARAVLEDVGFNLTYARVDLVATPEGWAVMELELVEPSLFLSYDEGAPARLARAIHARAISA